MYERVSSNMDRSNTANANIYEPKGLLVPVGVFTYALYRVCTARFAICALLRHAQTALVLDDLLCGFASL